MNELLAPVRRLRASVTTPNEIEVDPGYRGFYEWREGPSIVPPVGRSFLDGFRIGMRGAGATEAVRQLMQVPREWQGFAAEGAGMSVAIRSAVEPWHRNEFHRLVSVSGGRHTYMMHVGLGWALARLPRPLWPDLSKFDPAVGQLILDGYGFHEIFFNTAKTLRQHTVEFDFDAWPGPVQDAQQQLMQGVGRGMWFVAGGSPQLLHEIFEGFDPKFHSSLWAGTGLAATYAGGRGPEGLNEVLERAGEHAGWVRQGCAFAVDARHRANTTNDHTRLAAHILCGLTVERIVEITTSHRPEPQRVDSGDWGAYEEWRARIAGHLRVAAAQRVDEAV